MTAALRKLAKVIAAGLTYAARTAAMREGLPWDGDDRRTGGGKGKAPAPHGAGALPPGLSGDQVPPNRCENFSPIVRGGVVTT